MDRSKTFEPSFQKAFTEAIHKENKIRVHWSLEYAKKRAAALKSESLEQTADVISYLKKQSSEEGIHWPQVNGTGTIIRVREPTGIMFQPEKKTKDSLYDGISHDGAGRAGYLKDRNRLNPEDKYHVLACNAWECGWKLRETAGELECKNPDVCGVRNRCFSP